MSILPGSPTSRVSSHGAEADRIARLAVRLTSSQVATVRVHDAIGEHADPQSGNVAPVLAGRTVGLPCGRAISAQTVEAGRLQIVSADDVAPPHKQVGYVCVPIRGHGGHEGETVGAICVLDARSRSWTETQVADLVELAEVAAAGIAMSDLAADREEARAELAREHAFLNAVLENLTDGVAACDRDGTLVYFNPALREVHGLPEQTMTSADWADAYDLFDADGERRLEPDEVPLARAFLGETVRNQHMVVRAGNTGTARHFHATGSPINGPDGSRLGAVVSMRDITADHRRRQVRTSHLAIATALAEDPGSDEAIATALMHLRTALQPGAADVIMAGRVPDHDIDARVVRAVTRSARPVQAALTAPYRGYVVCAPLVVASTTVGVLYLAGESDALLDDLSASIVEAVAGLLGRCLERERAEELDRELKATRHDLERVIRHAQDYVWSVEFLPSGRGVLRATTSPAGILGGAAQPDEGQWLDMLKDRVDPRDMPELITWRDGLLRGRPGEFTCRLRGDDGLVRWIRTRCTVRSEDGRRYLDGISSDVTGNTRFEVVREPKRAEVPADA